MSRKWFTNKYYIRLSISIIAFSALIVILLSIAFSTIYSNSLFKEMTDQYKANVNTMNVGFENLNKEMDQLYTLLELDINVYSFLNEKGIDDMTKVQAMLSANKICQINPYVDSIILYNLNINDYAVVGNLGLDPTQTVEKAKVNIKNRIGIKSFIPNEIKENQNGLSEPKRLISLVYGEISSDKKSFESIIIINLDRDAVQNGILEKSVGTTLISDNEGDEITYSGDSITGINVSPLNYFEYINSNSNDLDSIPVKIGKEQEIVTFIKNKEFGWNIINILSYTDMAESLHTKRNNIILIGILVLIISLFLGYLISNMLYSPIKKVTNKFKLSRYADGMYSEGEISLISGVYDEALKHVVNLEQKTENYLPKIKEDFLRCILRVGKEEDIDSELEDYQISIKFENLIVVAVKIGNHYENSDDKLSNESTAVAGMLEVLEGSFKSEAVTMYSGEICILLNFIDENNNSFELLLSTLENLRAFLQKRLGDIVTIGVGGVANNIDECRKAYLDAMYMVKYRFVLGHGKVIYQRYIESNLTTGINYPKEIEKKLISAIHMNDKESFTGYLGEIISILKNYIYEDAVVICMQMILECIRAMNQITARYKSLNIDFDMFGMMPEKVQTLEQVQKWMVDIFDEYQSLQGEIDSMKSNKYYEMVEDIKAYIDKNYTDINLGVEGLAEKTGYTPNYFARIFKNVSGQYVNDYIKQKRIAKAKELLKNSNYSVQEISNMVGFINSTYFYSAFRKDVGLTPATYRNYKVTENEIN